ncbi:MAG TPA: 50S ribosomal protein L11 methyltransferase [Thermoanaerobaculia bacterium]
MVSPIMDPSNYYILEIAFDPDLEDVVEGRLFLTRSTGNQLVRPGMIEAYFDSAADRDAAGAMFENATAVDRPRVDWLQLYQQSLQPLLVGKSFVIAPDASLLRPNSGRHELIIPQEQAFGTGSHESTALCIELLEEVDLRGRSVLDVGAGSGILALAMLRLGARKAFAFDVDLDAFGPLRENAMRNHLPLAAFIGTLDALRVRAFDVITVNILPEVIVPMLGAIKTRLHGALILSGILEVQREYVLDACERRGLRLDREGRRGEWWAGSFKLAPL